MSGIADLENRVAGKRRGKLWRSVEAFSELIEFPLDDFQISLIVVAIKRRSVWHISAMRKIGKTHILGFLILFLGCAGYTGIYCNHKLEFVKELFEFVKPYAERLKELGFVSKIEPSHGFLNIYFSNGASAFFRVRSPGFGRGYMKMDYVLWDEAQKSSASQGTEVTGAMQPSKLNLQIYMGNPATKKDVLTFPDSKFLQAKIKGSKTMIEFSAADKYDPKMVLDAELLRECNPNVHRLGDLDELLQLQWDDDKSHEEVAAELYGIWNLPEDAERIDPTLSSDEITQILTKIPSKSSLWYLSVAIDYKSNEAFMVINDGVTVELAQVIKLSHGSVEPVSEWILHNKNRFRKIFIMGTAKGKVLVDLLHKIKGRIEVIQPQAFAVSLDRFLRQVKNETLRVFDTPDIRAALGSFWIAHDPKTNAPIAKASTPEHVSLVMSLMMAAVKDDAIDRIRNLSGATLPDMEDEMEEVEEAPKELDPMAAYKAQREAIKNGRKKIA